jgi:GGDEF domain-containing protein/thioredoxin-like negative regulator of GroEL
MADRADIAKRVERAEKFLQKGKPEAALEEYLSVLQEDRENDTVRQMAADLSISVGRGPEAVALLGELFERQVAVGDATRASLTYKKLARHSNPTTEQKIKFGQLLEGSNRKLALETYEAGLHELGAKGSKAQQMAVLKRIVALDASMPNFVRIGELAAELGDGRGAAAAFLRVAELTEQSGGAPATWYERAYQADGTNPKIALSYGRSLLVQGEAGAAIFVLTPLLNEGAPSNELRDVYAGALLAAGRFKDAEPHVMALFEQNPSRLPQVTQLIGDMIDAQMDRDAVGLARKLEQFQRRRGERRAFLATMQELVSRHRSSADLLEFLVELYNSSNRETDYCQTLLRLFDLYHKTGNFAKAGECLDRAAEVDPYEPGHQRRLELLKGNLDETQFNAIASRLAPTGGKKPTPETTEAAEPSMGASALQDLMLQAEILVQYGMHAKAGERLQRIQELFPTEAEHNEELQRLYTAAGIAPPVAAKPVAPSAPPPSLSVVAVTPPSAPATAPATPQGPDLNQLTRVAEVSRQLYRQNDPSGVLSVVAKEVGSLWKLTRCIAATRKPGQAMSSFQEFHATGSRHAEEAEAADLVAVVDDLCRTGPMVWPNVASAAELQGAKAILTGLNVAALLALPMSDGEEHAGVLLLMQDTVRAWHENETFVVRTIAEQAGMALRNLGLRRLVSNLSVTDAKSGLLSRSSYLDVLFGEARRSQEESSSLTTVLMQFGESAALVKQFGQDAVEAMMQQIGRILAGHIRQNDFAFRYETATVALILGNTGEVNALQAVEKFRALLTGIHWPNQTQAVQFATGVAEAVIRPQFDPVDIVTEVINRVEQALDLALCDETAGVQVLGSTFAAAAAVA